ncbi:MAG: hypothetical protein ACI9N0_001988 [Ilumatobacter sp.]|jgi:hypothetical protein
MYLFNRSLVAARGRAADAVSFALESSSHISAVTGLEFSVFSSVFGRPIGTLSWTAMVDSLKDFQEATDKLNADAKYQQITAGAAELFDGGGHDVLGQLVSATADPAPHGWYSVTEATIDAAHGAAAMEFGVAMQAYIETTYEVSTAFFSETFNQMGSVAWTIGFDSPKKFDAMSSAIMTDAKYSKMVADAAGFFVLGSGTRSLTRRIS